MNVVAVLDFTAISCGHICLLYTIHPGYIPLLPKKSVGLFIEIITAIFPYLQYFSGNKC